MTEAASNQTAGIKRPLSPHLQVYRWQWSNTLSILHRATGCALAVGLLVLTVWLVMAAMGPASYTDFQNFAAQPLSIFCLVGWGWCLSYHLLNGIRHLFWDAGAGYEIKNAAASGWSVVFGSFVLTGLMLAGAYYQYQMAPKQVSYQNDTAPVEPMGVEE